MVALSSRYTILLLARPSRQDTMACSHRPMVSNLRSHSNLNTPRTAITNNSKDRKVTTPLPNSSQTAEGATIQTTTDQSRHLHISSTSRRHLISNTGNNPRRHNTDSRSNSSTEAKVCHLAGSRRLHRPVHHRSTTMGIRVDSIRRDQVGMRVIRGGIRASSSQRLEGEIRGRV